MMRVNAIGKMVAMKFFKTEFRGNRGFARSLRDEATTKPDGV